MKKTLFPPSPTCQRYLNGLTGIEIGGSAHNHSGLDPQPINVDYTDELTSFKQEEINLVGWSLPVDVVADMGNLPFGYDSFDYIFSSHVLEHAIDPISVLRHWDDIARQYIAIILPHPERTFDKDRSLTTIEEIGERYDAFRHFSLLKSEQEKKEMAIKYGLFGWKQAVPNDHWNVWTPETFGEFVTLFGFEVMEMVEPDDKVGNGFLCILKTTELPF